MLSAIVPVHDETNPGQAFLDKGAPGDLALQHEERQLNPLHQELAET
jgi:hypothetical protein